MDKDFSHDPRPIGVFDSGVGGLTVLRALQSAMPGENFIYIGDTARVPYGTKSAETVRAYALGLARVLLAKDVKMIVIACNTASAHATKDVAALAAPLPVIGMVEPAAAAALEATDNNNILVMATQSTTRHATYPKALEAARPAAVVQGAACQILVALAEEGWLDGPVAHAVVERYIGPYFAPAGQQAKPDTIILGCTHFPLLRHLIADVAGPGIALIDSGGAAAEYITANWTGRRDGNAGTTKFFVTDNAQQFRPVAERFMGASIGAIEHIDLDDFPDDGESRRPGPQRRPLMPSEKEKMLAGDIYRPGDPELLEDAAACGAWLQRYNSLPFGAGEQDDMLRAGPLRAGANTIVRPIFFCDYGYNIALGDDIFINFNCVILDVARVTIGDGAILGPNAQILTADHPRDPAARAGLAFGRPVSIGRKAWIGAGAIILPGVTIGDHAIIGAGSIVTRDVAAGTTVAGNPARPTARVPA